MNLRCVRREIGIPLVGCHHNGSRFRDDEIRPRHADSGLEKVWPGVFPHHAGEVANIFIVGIRSVLLRKQDGYVFGRLVNRRADDMAWRLIVQLLNTLTEVSLCDPDTSSLEERTQFTFLRQHGLGLD